MHPPHMHPPHTHPPPRHTHSLQACTMAAGKTTTPAWQRSQNTCRHTATPCRACCGERHCCCRLRCQCCGVHAALQAVQPWSCGGAGVSGIGGLREVLVWVGSWHRHVPSRATRRWCWVSGRTPPNTTTTPPTAPSHPTPPTGTRRRSSTLPAAAGSTREGRGPLSAHRLPTSR